MFNLRLSLTSRYSLLLNLRYSSEFSNIYSSKNSANQIEYIKSLKEGNKHDWPGIKNNVLSQRGAVNQKNFDAILLKTLVSSKKIDAALSYAAYLKSSPDELSLGSINGLLQLYSQVKSISEKERNFILQCYHDLYKKYKVLDFKTCERLIHALCVINEMEKAFKVLDNLKITCSPSHSVYSSIIAALFNSNKKAKALEVISQSVNDKRPLLHNAYEAWINYILRKYKDKNTIAKYLEEICSHVARNCAIVTQDTANLMIQVYTNLGWNANFTKMKRFNGECHCCKEALKQLDLTQSEFEQLQQNVKDKLIVGSDLFLKSSPQELNRFIEFVQKTAPYDIVLDSLNIAHSVNNNQYMNKAGFLNDIVDYFIQGNKKVLLLGRKHMLKWPKRSMERLMSSANCFFTENISEDDPYFIAAALLSGSHTDIVSKDLLRGHKFLFRDEHLMYLFKRWQWQHQWMVFPNFKKGFIVQEPLKFTPCAQKLKSGWHLPYEKADSNVAMAQFNDGTPNLSSWICIRHSPNR